MSRRKRVGRIAAATLCAVALLPSCSKNDERKAVAGTSAPAALIDPCALITDADIETTQGARPAGKALSRRTDGGVVHSQCYVTLPVTSDSLAIIVTQRGTETVSRDPRELWQGYFHSEDKKEEEREKEEGEKAIVPQKVSGLGDEAYWVWQRFGGSLHVLKGSTFLRINVGGPGDEAQKRKKLQALAELLLPRL